MLVSYNQLQRFFDDTLPPPQKLAERLTFGAFEIEGVEKNGDDTIIDVKVLPDRACYALSHRGIAREVATLTGIVMKHDSLRDSYPELTPRASDISVSVADQSRAPFYSAALIKGITVGPSPDWLKKHLESIGQQSINNIVDAANFIMFELGTPLHVFDADKLSGAIEIRPAKAGEKITVLGGEEKTLTEEMTVIADKEKGVPIAIAGVKGGAYAELTSSTKNILIEAAKFDPASTRKTAHALHLKTDASKRFENNIAIELPAYGMQAVVELILEIAGGKLLGFSATELPYSFPYKSGISTEEVNRTLGTHLKESDITNIFDALGFAHERIENPVARALEVAKAQMGKPYQIDAYFSKTVPHTFDCSSLVAYAYLLAGVPIPRDSVDQYLWGEPITEAELKPGDLIFSNSKQGKVWLESSAFIKGRAVPEGVDHVGMYLGDGKVIHATRYGEGKVIEESVKESSRFGDTVVGYRRVTTDSESRFSISIPFERLDIRLPQDIVEEIGRIHGYENIQGSELPPLQGSIEINPRHYWTEKIRALLSECGFIEMYTYSLQPKGDVALANAFASDKAFLRKNISDAMKEKLASNTYNGPLIGAYEKMRLFEIGQVFTKEGERTYVCYGARGKDAEKEGKQASDELEKLPGVKKVNARDGIGEYDITDLVQKPAEAYPLLSLVAKDAMYTPFSQYPFVLRDIALWVSGGTSSDEVRALIQKEAGELLMRIDQFDTFSKDGRTSYAFHLVFQSSEKTLSDTEVHEIMDGVQKAIAALGWEIR